MTLRVRKLLLTALLLVTAALAALVSVPTAQGAFIAGTTNKANTAASNPYFTCAAAEVGETGTNAYFAYPFSDAAGPTAADVSGNNRLGTYTTSGVTYGVSSTVCPRDKATVITLDGASGYVVSATGAQLSAPQVFSEEIWFKTSTAAGKLIGFGASNSLLGATSGTYDRHLYVNSSGLITFGVYNGGFVTLTSPAPAAGNYTDGKWHYVLGSMSSAGMRLYVDGALVASNTNTAAESTTGYWHIGFDNLANWPGAPASYYVKGQLARAAVYTYALSAGQVASHYAAGAS